MSEIGAACEGETRGAGIYRVSPRGMDSVVSVCCVVWTIVSVSMLFCEFALLTFITDISDMLAHCLCVSGAASGCWPL